MARAPATPPADFDDDDVDLSNEADDLRFGKAPADEAGASRRDNRRAHDTRVDEVSEVHATHQDDTAFQPWIRPSSLDAPPPRQGYVQRWVRVSFRGADDPRNRNRRMREGWNPRPIASISADWQGIGANAGSVNGAFVVDDLMLCEMPEKAFRQRAAYYRQLTEKQMEAVELDLEREQVPGHRIHRSHKTAVTHPARVVGRQVEAADD